MKAAFVLCALVALVASATAAPSKELALTQTFVDQINAEQTHWTAHLSPRFEGATFADVARLCGTVMPGEAAYFRLPEKQFAASELSASPLPENFDSRTNWPKCASVIGHIRDQSDCGSCWAFGSTEAFNDRICMKTGNTTLLSVEATTSCCGFLECFSMGCNGGQPSGAWRWFSRDGLVSGGDYDDKGKSDTCQPYSLAPCAHHVAPSPGLPACGSSEYPTPKCEKSCTNPYAKSFDSDKRYAKSSYSVSGVQQIMQEIATNGPVTGAFTVYSDFPAYKQGVYKKTSGATALGGHAIKLIGWGTENGQDYWLVNNSWNDKWGDNGTFKILKGVDECGIESSISAGSV